LNHCQDNARDDQESDQARVLVGPYGHLDNSGLDVEERHGAKDIPQDDRGQRQGQNQQRL
jgi:hypothetical protein